MSPLFWCGAWSMSRFPSGNASFIHSLECVEWNARFFCFRLYRRISFTFIHHLTDCLGVFTWLRLCSFVTRCRFISSRIIIIHIFCFGEVCSSRFRGRRCNASNIFLLKSSLFIFWNCSRFIKLDAKDFHCLFRSKHFSKRHDDLILWVSS